MNTKKKIVVVEDDPDLLFLLGKVLSRVGYHVECLRDGSIILNADFVLPDLFILDRQLGCVDGIMITKYLKSFGQQQRPIVMMSGTKEYERHALIAGVDYFLEKPLNIKNLLQIVESLLSNTPTQGRTVLKQETGFFSSRLKGRE
jgi:DNA-binding response OmpR family regulator